MLETCFDEKYGLPDAKRNNIQYKYGPDKLFRKTNNYDDWFENEESTDKGE